MLDLGTVLSGSTIRIPFNTFDKDDGSSITMTNYAAADILIYKDGSTTERASTAGFTATTDFDSKTGKQLIVIDLADNTTADFYAAGSEYLVAVDAVTVDGVTVGGWVARFRIGIVGAILDTTIATLSSQTSFTLTAGPADDSALVGSVVVVRDAASAIQQAVGVCSAYTGSTKTVTLLADPAVFTMAAKDNISFLPDRSLKPTVPNRTLDVTTTGGGGIDWANVENPTTSLNLSGTSVKTATDVETDTQDIQARLPAALTANGNIKADALRVGGTVQTGGDLSAQIDAVDNFIDTEIADIQARLPAALTSDGNIKADALRHGGTLQTGRDIGASVLLSSGTGTGQILLSSGTVTVGTNNDKTGYSLTQSFPSNFSSLGINASGHISRVTLVDTTTTNTDMITAAQIRAAVGLASANLDTQLSTIDDFLDTEVAAILAAVDTEVASIVTAVVTTIPASLAALFTTARTESYRADGATGTIDQILYEILGHVTEVAITGTTKRVNKIDGSTQAAAYTLDSGTAPTAITRSA